MTALEIPNPKSSCGAVGPSRVNPAPAVTAAERLDNVRRVEVVDERFDFRDRFAYIESEYEI